ncbi:MAG: helix-turn-helix domain-containing protein [Flavisolibacter sp.]
MLTELVHEEQLSALLCKATPSSALRPFIEHYRQTCSDGVATPIRFLPNIGFTIRFNLGTSFSIRNEEQSFELNDHMLIPNNQTWIDEGIFFAIKFRFGLLPQIKGNNQDGIWNHPVPLRDVLPENFIHSVAAATSFEDRIRLTEEYFLPLYENNTRMLTKYKVIEEMVNYFTEHNFSSFQIEKDKSNFVSSKSLQRYFLENFGLTPKSVYCILRVRKALEAYFNHSAEFRIYDFDYYDYSHFYKEIKRVVGLNLPQLKGNEDFRGIA